MNVNAANILKGLSLAVLAVVAVVFVLYYLAVPNFPDPNADGWQAMFLTNDQVYFGKLQDFSKRYVILENIFYLRVADPLQQGAVGQPPLNLVKLGGELHGPEDRMYVPKDKVMFWEDLRGDSQIVQAITQFYAQQAQQ